eukprot:9379410-Lingulodinium_polyedra.AAC.1
MQWGRRTTRLLSKPTTSAGRMATGGRPTLNTHLSTRLSGTTFVMAARGPRGVRGARGVPEPCLAVPCHAMPCHAMPCRAVPCRAASCRAVLCCAVPCRAVPCIASNRPCMWPGTCRCA